MLKVVVETTGEFYQHYPRPATIVTVNYDGRKNGMAVAWHCPVSFKPPLYGIAIAPKRYTYGMLSQSKQFGINFMPIEKAADIAAMGGSSGNLIDKFTEYGLAEDRPLKTDVPILAEAYAAFECTVVESMIFGDHAWIIGEILAVHVAEGVFKQNGILDLSLIKPALYLGADMYCTTDATSQKFYDREKCGKR